jgi:oligosaccharide repeat unit polymerase
MLAGDSKRSIARLDSLNFQGVDLFFWFGVAGICVSVLNYATGDIPLLSDDVNLARFTGDYGVLGRLWILVHPVTQVSVIIFLLKLRGKSFELRWTMLGIGSAASLILTGGRSLVAIALIAFGVLFLEIKRPKLRIVLIAICLGVVALGVFGQVRALSSSGVPEAQSFLAKRDLNGWFGSADVSLQTGPRVLTLAIDHLDDEPLGGLFLIGDLPKLRPSSINGSDQLVTQIIGRNPTVVGGSPPTIFGGLYLDFGWLGVCGGALLIGLLLVASRRIMYRTQNLGASIWFAYFAAYIAISGYSYVSLRPSWLVVLLMCIAANALSGESRGADFDSIEVQEVSRRRRTAHL